MCQGTDPSPVTSHVAEAKTMGHGKVMPPRTTDEKVILTYFMHMSEKLAARLRRNDRQAQRFFIGLRHRQLGWISDKLRTAYPTDDGRTIYQLCKQLLITQWHGEPIDQVQVTALDLKPINQQLDFFIKHELEREKLNNAVDNINDRYGEFTLSPARLLLRSKMPNVIAPAWKPDGHRQSIEKY